ncbi:hypothetical protein EV360DRAFT_56925 [Lentinula raphanica]|nr:hypothetical protein EV360DRAFT_56925 [Lentinula raphanica]
MVLENINVRYRVHLIIVIVHNVDWPLGQNLISDLCQNAFHIEHDLEIVAVESAPPGRRREWPSNRHAGPALTNTTLHTHGLAPAEMESSDWNGALISMLAREAENIQVETEDGRFGQGKINWEELIQKRFSGFYKAIHEFRQHPSTMQFDLHLRDRLQATYVRHQQFSKISIISPWVSYHFSHIRIV